MKAYQWVDDKGADSLNFVVEGGLFLACFPPGSSACGLSASDSELSLDGLRTALNELRRSLSGVDITACEWKAVGSSLALRMVDELCNQEHLSLIRRTERIGKFDVWFFPVERRIQVSRAKVGPLGIAEGGDADGTASGPVHQGKIKVLIVDDSKTIRDLLSRIFSADPDLEVIGAAEKPSDAVRILERVRPDVITLDFHMPEMDGLAFLKQYLPRFPIPTIMITSITMEEGPMVLNALEAGAVDYIQKPSLEQLKVLAPLIVEKVKIARRANVKVRSSAIGLHASRGPESFGSESVDQSALIVMGASTGGTEALREVLTRLPEKIPPILIVQHIPPVFSKAFADRLNALCPFEVKEAQDGDAVRPGRVIVAAGGTQMKVIAAGGGLKISVTDDAPVNRHKPSVDYLFASVQKVQPAKLIAVILTGMGADGARELANLRKNGARTIAQDEETCVVFGMPKEAIRMGGADKVLPLQSIPQQMVRWLQEMQQGRKKESA